MRGERRALGGKDPLDRVVRRSRFAMALESFTRAFWPLGSALAALWAALAFGLAEIATRGQLVAILAAAGLGLLALLLLGIRRFRWPRAAEARDRIDATLPGRPLATLLDTPALGRGDPAAEAVWAAHLARMRRLAASARPVVADLRLAARDPWALRLMALVALVAALVFARDRGVESVATALQAPPAAATAAGPSYEGWAEPPAYTGRPTLYLPEVPGDAPLAVPQGTVVTLRGYGDADRFALDESVSGGPPAALAEAAPGIASASFEVAASGTVTLSQSGDALGSWTFTMEPDAAPTIALLGSLERTATGETRLAYEAQDDHGIAAARADIALDPGRADRRYGLAVEPEALPPLAADLPLPMTGGADALSETLVEDFSKHPLAGLPVTVRLVAEDAIGQRGESPALEAVLPMRRFYDPVAQALIEQRRDLLWSAANARRVVQVLRATTNLPEGSFDSPRAYLVVRTAIRRLDAAEKADDVAAVRDEIAEALWQAAVQIEDGDLGNAAERLARAKERLQEALRERRHRRGDRPADGRAAPGDPRLHGADGARGDRERRDAAGRDPAGPDDDPGPDPGADGPHPGALRAGPARRGRGAPGDAAADAREHADDDGPERPAGRGPGRPGPAVDAGPRRRAARAAGPRRRGVPPAAGGVPPRPPGPARPGRRGRRSPATTPPATRSRSPSARRRCAS